MWGMWDLLQKEKYLPSKLYTAEILVFHPFISILCCCLFSLPESLSSFLVIYIDVAQNFFPSLSTLNH